MARQVSSRRGGVQAGRDEALAKAGRLDARSGVKRISLAGVPLDLVGRQRLLASIVGARRGQTGVFIANVNVHAHNIARRDREFRAALCSADLVFCDGFGIVLGAWLLGLPTPERMTPMDLMDDCCGLLAEQGRKVFLLGNPPGVAEAAARKLAERVGTEVVVGTRHGFFEKHGPENDRVVDEINASGADVLLVGLGMPLQEKWIVVNRSRLAPGVLMSVGALFEVYSGRLRRPPKWMCDHGFEWLGRLLLHPHRVWRRYLLGNPLFLVRTLVERLMGRATVRPAGASGC